MHIIAVDDERLVLDALLEAIHSAVPGCALSGFTSSAEALNHARANCVDTAFLDIRMPGIDGLALAKQLKDINARTNIIFVTGYSDYALDAFSLHASGYMTKPVSPRDVAREIENLRYKVSRGNRKIRVHTFGNFDIFVEDIPIVFKRTKSKEILAYLIDRQGATVSKKELANVLWGEAEYNRTAQKHLQTLITELKRALQEAGAAHILLRRQNSLAVIPSHVDCDYFDFLKGNTRAIKAFRGEYMANYGWAEYTAGSLENEKQQLERT